MKKPHVIVPTGVYDFEAANLGLELSNSTLKREVRLGRLRVAKRAGRYFLLGEWLLSWLRDGEVHIGRKGQDSGPQS